MRPQVCSLQLKLDRIQEQFKRSLPESVIKKTKSHLFLFAGENSKSCWSQVFQTWKNSRLVEFSRHFKRTTCILFVGNLGKSEQFSTLAPSLRHFILFGYDVWTLYGAVHEVISGAAKWRRKEEQKKKELPLETWKLRSLMRYLEHKHPFKV